jgi:uncharacterized membrane protein
MNGDFEPAGPFERRRLNRAILIVVAMTLAGIAFNDGVHALISAAEKSGPRLERLVLQNADRLPVTR